MSDQLLASLRAQGSSYDKAFDKLAAGPSLDFRQWIDAELVELIARDPDTAPARLAASELRSRESWRTPAKWALIVASLSFIVSIVALARTF
jgi:hypothetical protein